MMLGLQTFDASKPPASQGLEALSKALEAGNTPEQVIEAIYVRTFSRKPTEAEISKLMEEINKNEDKKTVLEDVFWATMNAKEFIFNH